MNNAAGGVKNRVNSVDSDSVKIVADFYAFILVKIIRSAFVTLV